MTRPAYGGRVLLERADVGATTVSYRTTLFVPDAEWVGRAHIRLEDGEVRFGPWEGAGEPPEWLRTAAHAFLRALYRERKGRPDVEWPTRLLRWREPR